MTSRFAGPSPLTSSDYGHWRFFPFRPNSWNRIPASASHDSVTPRRPLKWVGRYALGFAIVVLVTLFYVRGVTASTTTVGFTFLLMILSASTIWGLGVSCMMSVAATLAFDYFFLPPVGSLDVADPQDWVALLSFILTAVVGSSLSARAHSRAGEADRRRQEVERLYALSQCLLGEGELELSPAIPQHIMESFDADSTAIFLSAKREVHRAGGDSPQIDEGRLRLAALGKDLPADGQNNIWFAPLRSGVRVIGSVGISGPPVSKGTMGALGCLVAAAIERAGAIEHAAKMEAERQSEQFKSVMLDAIAHDFRTPLTGIKTSVTALLTDLEFDKEQKKELLAIIDEESDRIDKLLDKASEIARLESGDVKLEMAPHSIGELVTSALADCKRVSRVRPIHSEVKHKDLQVLADLHWARNVLVHLIVNAHLYSWPGQPITISSERTGGFALLSVADQGPGIEKAEVARIFEKFYRCKDQKIRAHGTGMGLPIAKAIVEAHGGTIEVVSRFGHGSVFAFSLPLDPGCGAGPSEMTELG
jgi:two-component system, OmpR family, sensor histidine kinase KdpD